MYHLSQILVAKNKTEYDPKLPTLEFKLDF